jgi:hypothetical protein
VTEPEQATVRSLAILVARLEERVNTMARSSGTADAQRVEELAARVDELADAVEQLAAARGGGEAAAPSWFAVTDPDQAAQMLVDLVPWVYRVVVPQVRHAAGDQTLPPCWMWHPERVEPLLALQQAWIDAYQGEAGRASAAIEWQARWLPAWQDETRRMTKTNFSKCDVSGHSASGPGYGAAAQRREPMPQEVAARLNIAPMYARWWVAYRRGVDAGPVPGLPLDQE